MKSFVDLNKWCGTLFKFHCFASILNKKNARMTMNTQIILFLLFLVQYSVRGLDSDPIPPISNSTTSTSQHQYNPPRKFCYCLLL